MEVALIISLAALAAALPGLGTLAYVRLRRREGLRGPFARPGLYEAASDVYMVGFWRSDDVPEDVADDLWRRLRDALGIPAGATSLAAAAHVANQLRDAKQYGLTHTPLFPEEAKRGVSLAKGGIVNPNRLALIGEEGCFVAKGPGMGPAATAKQAQALIDYVEAKRGSGIAEQFHDAVRTLRLICGAPPRTLHHPKDLLHDAVERGAKTRIVNCRPRREWPRPQREFPPPFASAPWANDAVMALLPRELIIDLGEKHDMIICEVDRIPGGTLGGPAGLVAHGIQRLLRDACAGGTTDDAEARLEEWYSGYRNVRRRRTGGRTSG